MTLTKEAKLDIVGKHGRHEGDTGSPEVQIASSRTGSTSSPGICARTRRTTIRAAACSSSSVAAAGCRLSPAQRISRVIAP